MIKLIHNCPNCGATLRHDGYCEYCKTKIRYANELEIQRLAYHVKPIEMLLKVVKEDHTILIPVRGHISSLNLSRENDYPTFYGDNQVLSSMSSQTNVSFEFDGRLIDLEEEDDK